MVVVTGTFPCGQQLVKYGYKEKAECIFCKKAYEENGGSWKGELPKETIGHIQSAGCLGQKEVVTAAHNACIRELLQEIRVHGKADRHMKLLTLERDQEQCTRFCSIPAAWAHYGIKNSVRSFARRMNCGKQRKRRK